MYQKSTLIIPVGISGSGKTIYTKSLEYCHVISSDDIRQELFGMEYEAKQNKDTFAIYNKRIKKALESNVYKTIVADSTNLYLNGIKNTYRLAYEVNCPVEIHLIETPFEECCKRNSMRILGRVSDERMEEQREEKEKITRELIKNSYLCSLTSFVYTDNETKSYVLKKQDYILQTYENDKENFIKNIEKYSLQLALQQ